MPGARPTVPGMNAVPRAPLVARSVGRVLPTTLTLALCAQASAADLTSVITPINGLLVALTGLGTAVGTNWVNARNARTAAEKTKAENEVARDAADTNALQQRDETVKNLLEAFTVKMPELIERAARSEARVEILEKRELEREEREMGRIAKLASLEERLKHVDNCAGGLPCPLSGRRIQTS